MPILNYTTTVGVNKSVADIQKLLSRRVAALATHYDEDGNAVGLDLTIRTPHGPRSFSLPVNVEGAHAALRADPDANRPSYKTLEHAHRVAWRIAYDWLKVQVALIDAQMATMDQVMLPYLITPGGATLYDNYKAREQAALESGDTNGR